MHLGLDESLLGRWILPDVPLLPLLYGEVLLSVSLKRQYSTIENSIEFPLKTRNTTTI